VDAGKLRDAMNGQENPVELLVICAVMLVLGILGVAGALSRGLLDSMDGLLILSISLLTAVIFAALLFVLAKGQGWTGKRRKQDVPAASLATSPTGK
jgi:hypothetical protein